ncbi:MAG: MGMT family protein [Candidatus Eisenbacteria bacterium]
MYRAVRRIPRGRVATYGAVASVAGLPGRARLVGYALYASGPHRSLPWHRVLGAGGRLTLGKLDPDAALTQRLRLEAEGVRFDGRGRADLDAHGWPSRPRVPAGRRRNARPRSR